MNVGEEEVGEVGTQPSIKVQVLPKAQLRVVEIEICESNVASKKRRAIMDKVTLLEKVIRIPNPK